MPKHDKFEAERYRKQRIVGGGGPHGMGLVEKPKDLKKTWLKIFAYVKKYIPAMLIAVLASVIGILMQVIGPNILKEITDEIAKGLPAWIDGREVIAAIDMAAVLKLAYILLGFYIIAALMSFVQGLIMATITQRISQMMRNDISEKINRLPLKYFDKNSYGDVLSRMTNDVDTLGQSLNQSIAGLITSLVMFLGVLFMMFYNSWILTLTAIGASAIGLVAMILIMTKSQKYFKAQQENLGDLNGHIEEIYTGHNVVKVYNGSRQARADFEDINDKLYDSAWKSQFISGLMMPIMHFVGNLGYVLVCVVGAVLVVKGMISFGVIVAFMLYTRLFSQPLSQIAQAANSLQRSAAAGERVFEFLAEEELEDEGDKVDKLGEIKGQVEFRNVRFGYDPDKIIIKDFSTMVEPGQKVAIVGPTGAGKTTLVNLLMRFYDLDGGEILIDGVAISQVPRDRIHELFAMVLQDSWIFEGTIRENIIFNQEGISHEQVVEACKMAGLHHFIMTLPDNYDTILDDKASLSEGQMQLITIARAMIHQAPLLILDEATSSVDTRTERIVQAAMDKLTANRTSFVIAHRLSTIKNADVILVLQDGDIVERGSHDELYAQAGYYRELYDSQFELVS